MSLLSGYHDRERTPDEPAEGDPLAESMAYVQVSAIIGCVAIVCWLLAVCFGRG